MYAGKEDILGIMVFFQSDYTVDNISDELQILAERDIYAKLYLEFLEPPSTDINGLLKAAEVCFYMEHAGMVREIENAFGVVGEERIGEWTKKYENGMPMFFFAQGSSRPFLELLPHETWRMRGYKYVEAYINAYYLANKSSFNPYGVVSTDNTARGYGWNTSISDYDYDQEIL